ncbi:MAG: YceI family protein [Acidobacteriota bacterium]|nr:YceI family protein [Acidobacteriota bacterium]MDE3170528.1 YceI family protein [Acidobacteriota bacterium]
MKWLVVAGLAAALALPALADTTEWSIDPNHANAQFFVKHLGISTVQGEFTKVTGTVTIDNDDVTKSTVDVTIPADTVYTRVTMRDNDLKSQHFLDVAEYQTITFKSTSITKTGDDAYDVNGNLTIRGVTKPVTLKVTDLSKPIDVKAMGGWRRGASAETTINRQDFGVAADPGMVGDQIHILIDLEMTHK